MMSYHLFVKKKLRENITFEALEDSHVFNHEILKLLKDTCGDDEMIFEIARGLIRS